MNRVDSTITVSRYAGPIAEPTVNTATLSHDSSQSTIASADLRSRATSNFFSDGLHRLWQAIVHVFKSLCCCFCRPSRQVTPLNLPAQHQEEQRPVAPETLHPSLPLVQEPQRVTALTPREREERIRSAETIPDRLVRQLERAQFQMIQESARAFQHASAPQGWDEHEELVGGLRVGVSHVQGRRQTMEDEHIAKEFELEIAGRTYRGHLFGIFDGHGGSLVAQFLRDNLQRKLQQTLIEFNREGLTEDGIWNALKMTCVRLNRDLESLHPQIARNQGSTATIAMILDGNLWTANVGDSRTVLDNNGTPFQLSRDAKPADPLFRAGIEHRGGNVTDGGTPRVNGILAVARAFGDLQLNGAVSVRPTITVISLSVIQPESHLILCCDGIFDVARTIDVVNLAYRSRGFFAWNRRLSVGEIARDITSTAYQAGSTDNLSALVVKIA